MPRSFKYRYIEFRLINIPEVTLRINASDLPEFVALKIWIALRKKMPSAKFSTCIISTNEEKPEVKRGKKQ